MKDWWKAKSRKVKKNVENHESLVFSQNSIYQAKVKFPLKDNIWLIPLTGVFITGCAVMSMFQIPLSFFPGGFLNLDFSLTLLILFLMLFGVRPGFFVAIPYPWLALAMPSFGAPFEVIGQLANMLVAVTTVFFYGAIRNMLFAKEGLKSEILTGIIATLFITAVMVLLNLILIFPLYGLSITNSKNLKLIFISILPFNIMLCSISFTIAIITFPTIVFLRDKAITKTKTRW